MAQCLHEGETRAVILRKKGPVRRHAVPGRALFPEFFSEGTRLRSVKSGKALLSGERYIREKHTMLLWVLPKEPRENSVKSGKALYSWSVISEFHCISSWFLMFVFVLFFMKPFLTFFQVAGLPAVFITQIVVVVFLAKPGNNTGKIGIIYILSKCNFCLLVRMIQLKI